MIYELFRNHLYSRLFVLVEFDDCQFICDPRDTAISSALMAGNSWQRDELSRAIAFLEVNGGRVFVDTGANIGTQTVYALLSSRFSHCLAIEPEPKNAQLFRRNMQLNKLQDQVDLVEAAASNSPGTASLRVDKKNHGGHKLQSESGGDSIEVATLTLDDLIRQSAFSMDDVGLVWIDVEGHEISVLEGMTALLAKATPFVIEFDPSNHKRGWNALLEFVAPYYASVVDLRSDELAHPVAGFRPVRGMSDYLFFGRKENTVA